MASPARVAANRNNATKSIDPWTARGESSSALDRRSHGLRATATTIPREDPVEWDRFGGQIVASLATADPLEAELGLRVALSFWCI